MRKDIVETLRLIRENSQKTEIFRWGNPRVNHLVKANAQIKDQYAVNSDPVYAFPGGNNFRPILFYHEFTAILNDGWEQNGVDEYEAMSQDVTEQGGRYFLNTSLTHSL